LSGSCVNPPLFKTLKRHWLQGGSVLCMKTWNTNQPYPPSEERDDSFRVPELNAMQRSLFPLELNLGSK
jgi:hypothetical protein